MVEWHHQINGHEFEVLRELVMDKEAWLSAVHGVTKSRTRLRDLTVLNWNNIYLKQLRWSWSEHCMTNFKMTIRAYCVVSTCSPLSLWKFLPTDCQWGQSAFRQESTFPTHPQLLTSEIKEAFLSTSLASVLALEQPAARNPLSVTAFGRPTWGCALMTSGSSGFSRANGWSNTPRWLKWASCSWLAGPKRGILRDTHISCRNHLFWGSSQFLPRSALAADLRFSLVKKRHASGWTDKLQDPVSPSTSVNLGKSLLSTKHYMGLLLIGSVDCLPFSTVCEWKVLFGHFCQLEKAVAPHSSTLAWKIPWTEEPGRLKSMGSLRVGHDWAISLSLFTFMRWRRKWQPTPVFLPGESQGRRSLVGCRLWSCTESDMNEVT